MGGQTFSADGNKEKVLGGCYEKMTTVANATFFLSAEILTSAIFRERGDKENHEKRLRTASKFHARCLFNVG
jgi:hypothetical protein